MRRLLSIGSSLVAALTLAGCLQPVTEAPVQKAGRQRTFAAPRVDPKVSEDGRRFESDHFVIVFKEGVEEHRRYATEEDRTSLALGKLVQLEAVYNFLNSIFGFELTEPATVVIEKAVAQVVNVRGGAYVAAYVSGSDPEFGGKPVAHFSPDSAGDRATLVHEIIHLLDHEYIGTRAPAWFAEGLATMVENELIGGGNTRRASPIGFDEQGRNLIQRWQSHRSRGVGLPDNLEVEAYNHSYHILATLRDKYGDEFYRKLFIIMREDGRRVLVDADLIALMSEAAGEELEPLFVNEFSFQLEGQRELAAFEMFLTEAGTVSDGVSTAWRFSDNGIAQRQTRASTGSQDLTVEIGTYTLEPVADNGDAFIAHCRFVQRHSAIYAEATRDYTFGTTSRIDERESAVLQNVDGVLVIDGTAYTPTTGR